MNNYIGYIIIWILSGWTGYLFSLIDENAKPKPKVLINTGFLGLFAFSIPLIKMLVKEIKEVLK